MLPITSPRRISFLNPTTPDPWRVDDKKSWYFPFKLLIGAFLLLPIRIIGLLFSVFWMWFFSVLGTIGYCPPKDISTTKPHGPIRRLWKYPIRFGARMALFFLGFWWIKVKKHKGSEKQASLIVGNHVTYYDAFYVAYALDFCPVAKAELQSWPLVGTVLKYYQTILVFRKDPNSKHIVRSEIERRSKPDSGFPPVLVFPEGTTTNGRVLILFKTGPFSPMLPVLPLCLSYPHRYLDLGNGEMERVIRAMLEFRLYLTVTHLPVCSPDPLPEGSEADPGVIFAEKVRKLIASELNIPITQHSYEDVFLFYLAKRARIPQDFEVSKMRNLFKLSFDDIEKLMVKFSKIDKSHDGLLSLEDFSRTFGHETPPPDLVQIFEILDRNQTGKIDFRQFVYGLAILHENANLNDKVALAFRIYDKQNKGSLSKQDLLQVVQLCISSGFVNTNPKKAKNSVSASTVDNAGAAVTVWIPEEEVLTPEMIHARAQAEVDQLFADLKLSDSDEMTAEMFQTALLSQQYGQVLDLPLHLMRGTILPAELSSRQSLKGRK